jgi:hypothetical protein
MELPGDDVHSSRQFTFSIVPQSKGGLYLVVHLATLQKQPNEEEGKR